MSLADVLSLTAVALFIGAIRRDLWQRWVLFGASILAIYWLQPSTPIRHLDFWLPTTALALTTLVWVVVSSQKAPGVRDTLVTGITIIVIILAIGVTRYLGPLCCITPSRPPAIAEIAISLGLVGVIAIGSARLPYKSFFIVTLTLLLIGIFLVLKTEPWAKTTSAWLLTRTGQSIGLAGAIDLRWLGFSYLAFRLMHVLRDRLSGKLPETSLREFITYTVFFPAYIAGPIDRIQRFLGDLRKSYALSSLDILEGSQRLVVGVFKKFVIADSLAIIALNEHNAIRTISPFWLWIFLYAYAFQIYFDFSGYTDIALGIGRLLGFKLPENFDRPYLKENITSFWNSWHITLAQWFRAYFFNPLTRYLRSSAYPFPAGLIIFIGQLSTMLLIGLWHGVTWNFMVWGLWHGIGLFTHNRWVYLTRSRRPPSDHHFIVNRTSAVVGTILTFHYVTLGWVWFSLPSISLSWSVFQRLFGF